MGRSPRDEGGPRKMKSREKRKGVGSSRRGGNRPSTQAWQDRTLEVSTKDQPDPIEVKIRRLMDEEIVILVQGVPPMFGDLVELRPPGTGTEHVVKGEVVALERARNNEEGILVTVYLEESLKRVLAKLESGARSPNYRDSAHPALRKQEGEGWDEESSAEEPAGQGKGHRPNSELHWGWVAGDYDSFQAGNVRATSSLEDVDFEDEYDEPAPKEEPRKGGHGPSDVYSKLAWKGRRGEKKGSGSRSGRSSRDEDSRSGDWRHDRRAEDSGGWDLDEHDDRQRHHRGRHSERDERRDVEREQEEESRKERRSPSSRLRAARRLIPGSYRRGEEYGLYSSAGAYGLTPTPRRKLRRRGRGDEEGRGEDRDRRAPRRRADDEVQRRDRAPENRRLKRQSPIREPQSPPPRKRVPREIDEERGPVHRDHSGSAPRRRLPPKKRPGKSREEPRRQSADDQQWDKSDSWRASEPPPEPRSRKKPRRRPAEKSRPKTPRPAPPAEAREPRRGRPRRRSEESGKRSTRAGEAKGRRPDSNEGVRQIESRASGARRGGASSMRGETAPAIGIDFGTTFSKIAVLDGDEVVLIEDTNSKAATRAAVPSSVACISDGTVLVGEPAREFLATDPTQVISSAKRVLGLRYSDPLANGLLGSLACRSLAGPNDAILFELQGRQFTVVEVVSLLLEHLVKMASNWAGTKVTKAVLTYPVDFDKPAKRELELAAKMAGIEVLAFVPEPVAAVMGCGFDGQHDSTVAVYDFGGGTFDASVVEVGNDKFSVLGSAGDRWLGGDDLDELLGRFVADEYSRTSGISLHHRRVEYQRLLFACEEAKRWLSTLESVDVILPRAALTAEGPKTLLVPVERNHFEDLAEDVITSSLEVCRQAAEEAGMAPEDADALLLTGGTTRIPVVRKGAQRYFGQRGVAGIHPEHAVVIGAAMKAAVLTGQTVPKDIAERLRGQLSSGHTVGLALADGSTEPIIEAVQRPPVAAHRLFSTSIDGQTACRIELVQGGSSSTDQNHPIGGFVIDGLPPRPAGATNLDIYFELSSTGTLYVTAQDRTSGQRAQGTFDLTDD